MKTEQLKELVARLGRYANGDEFQRDVEASESALQAWIAEHEKAEPIADFLGYAALGTGQYLLNACPATDELPPELVIELATDEQKEGRTIGDLKYVEPGTVINPDRMAVRIVFFSVAGLDALEQQLRILREESFPETAHSDLEALRADAERWRAMSGLMFLGNVFAEQDEDGGYKITIDPAENLLGVSWEGNSPEEAIDEARKGGVK